MSDRVTIEDVRRAGYCTRGARRWFNDNNLDFAKFLAKDAGGSYIGITVEEFTSTNCPMALDIVKKKEARNG